MKTLIAAVWHMLGVVCAPLYWIMTLLFLWGGSIIMATDQAVGWATVGLAVGLFASRFFIVPKLISSKMANVLGCVLFLVFMLGAQAYGAMQTQCGMATHADGRQERICL